MSQKKVDQSEKTANPALPFRVRLSHAPNPDILDGAGYWDEGPLDGEREPGDPRLVDAASLVEASLICREYIVRNGLGGGNWTGGQVYDADGGPVASVSFNGRVWEVNGKTEIPVKGRPTFEELEAERRAEAGRDAREVMGCEIAALKGAVKDLAEIIEDGRTPLNEGARELVANARVLAGMPAMDSGTESAPAGRRQARTAYTHDFDVVFTVGSDEEDWEALTPAELLSALRERVAELTEGDILEAAGFLNTIPLGEEEKRMNPVRRPPRRGSGRAKKPINHQT